MISMPSRAALPIAFCLAAASAAGAAVVDPGGTYRGVTSQGKACGAKQSAPCAVIAQVSRSGTQLKRLEILWSARCGGDTVFNDSTEFLKFALPATGRVNISGRYEDSAGSGLTGRHKVVLRGRFTQGANGSYRLKGTFTDRIEVDSDAGTEHFSCKTGRVRFTATT